MLLGSLHPPLLVHFISVLNVTSNDLYMYQRGITVIKFASCICYLLNRNNLSKCKTNENAEIWKKSHLYKQLVDAVQLCNWRNRIFAAVVQFYFNRKKNVLIWKLQKTNNINAHLFYWALLNIHIHTFSILPVHLSPILALVVLCRPATCTPSTPPELSGK